MIKKTLKIVIVETFIQDCFHCKPKRWFHTFRNLYFHFIYIVFLFQNSLAYAQRCRQVTTAISHDRAYQIKLLFVLHQLTFTTRFPLYPSFFNNYSGPVFCNFCRQSAFKVVTLSETNLLSPKQNLQRAPEINIFVVQLRADFPFSFL